MPSFPAINKFTSTWRISPGLASQWNDLMIRTPNILSDLTSPHFAFSRAMNVHFLLLQGVCREPKYEPFIQFVRNTRRKQSVPGPLISVPRLPACPRPWNDLNHILHNHSNSTHLTNSPKRLTGKRIIQILHQNASKTCVWIINIF